MADLLPGGRATPGTKPVATVADDCLLPGARVHWATPAKEPRLTQVTHYREPAPGEAGKDLLREPFAPAVTLPFPTE